MMPWLVQTLVATTLLMGLVLALRAPVRRLFGARAAYALWLLPALRMVLPSLPGWRQLFVPVAVFRPDGATLGLVDVASAARLMPPPPGALPIGPAPMPLPLLDPTPPAALVLGPMLVALWLGVAALMFALAMLRYRRFMRDALEDAVPLATECGVEVLASPKVPGPVATGILRRRILLPADFLARYTPEERHLALLHEGAHHDRRDIVANLVALTIRSLHWWNPLAISAYRAFRADQELACDATVLADADRAAYAAYGRALLKSAVSRAPAMVCALNTKSQLKQRIATMAHAPRGRVRPIVGAVIAAATVVAGTIATASGIGPVPPVAPLAPVAAVAPAAPEAPVETVAPAFVAPAFAPVPPASVAPEHPAAEAPIVELSASEQGRIEEEVRRAAAQVGLAAADAGRQARIAARVAAEARRRTATMDVDRMVRVSLQRARDGLAARCAASGAPMPPSADFDALATCGHRIDPLVRTSLIRARSALATTPGLTDTQRARALAGLDAEIARTDR